MYKPRCRITGIQHGLNVQGEGRISQGANRQRAEKARPLSTQ